MKISAKTRLQSRINSAVMTLLVLCLAGMLGWLSTHYSWQMDWTHSGRHTLSVDSKEVLARMTDPINITAYARDNVDLREAIKKIVSRYQRIKPDIVLRFVNPDAVPDEVRNLGIKINGELILRYQERTEHVQSDNEEVFTNALQRLARGSQHWLAFIEGHGERSPLGKANHELGEWVQQLTNRGFKIQPLNLAQIQTIPENTQVLVIAGPQVDLLTGEMTLVLEYINRGGNVLWLADPGDLHGLDSLADYLNISLQPGMIMDFAGKLIGIDDPTVALVTSSMYPPHTVTKEFSYTTIFPTATAILSNENNDWRITPLLSTGDHTWLETGKLEGEVAYDEGSDQIGPLDIGVSLEREIEIENKDGLLNKQQRIIILGDGDFLSNTYVANSGNLDLGIRLINWLSSDDDFITIPARAAKDTHLELSPLAAGVIGFGFLIILPLTLLGTGLTIWWRRKKL
ncbi:MAG: GldG family protein [Gammaproteobacteria bacterium]